MTPHTYSSMSQFRVSPHITTCIFGIHSELRFKSAARDHDEKCITFVPTDGQMVQMPYLEEKSDGRSAFITGWDLFVFFLFFSFFFFFSRVGKSLACHCPAKWYLCA